MNVLFCYDGPITEGPLGEYYTISLTDEVLSRYYSFGDSLSLLIRVNENNDVSKLSKITVSPLSVIKVPEIKTLSGAITNTRKAKKIIKDAVKEADFIVVRTPSKIGQLAAIEANRIGKPYLVEVVAHPFNVLWHHSLRGKLIAFYESFQERKIIKQAPYAIYVTEEYLQRSYPCSGKSIGCADPIILLASRNVLVERLQKINGGGKKTIIGTIGGVGIKYKGQEYVIKALARLKQKGYDNYEYHLVGGGDFQQLQKVAERFDVASQCIYLGPLPHNQILKFLQKIDIYVQPSLTEGLPRSIVEAMSMATPCIASDCGGIPELIEKDFLYSNNHNRETQIEKLLIGFTPEKQAKQAIRNYEWSKKYSSIELDKRRSDFYNAIITDLKNNL